MLEYIEIAESEVPDGTKFQIPRGNQNQPFEVAYSWDGDAYWYDDADARRSRPLYRRVTDHSAEDPSKRDTFYRLEGE